jgi:hypothetical protein
MIRARTGAALLIGLIAALLIATPAEAASTRAEYVAQVDPICLTTGKRVVRAVKGIKVPREERLDSLDDKQALRLFFGFLAKVMGRANKEIGPMIAQIAPVPPPPGDERIVALWLQALGDYKFFADRAVRGSNHGKLNKFFYYFGKAMLVAEQANNLVDDWGFRYCASSDDSDYSGSSVRRPTRAAWLVPGDPLVAATERVRDGLARR